MIKKYTFSLLPVIRGLKKGNGDSVAVYLRITVDGFVKEISTKRFVQASKWNRAKGRVIRAELQRIENTPELRHLLIE